jgi:hypothetical protein
VEEDWYARILEDLAVTPDPDRELMARLADGDFLRLGPPDDDDDLGPADPVDDYDNDLDDLDMADDFEDPDDLDIE